MNRFDLAAPSWDQPRRLQRTESFAAAIRSELAAQEHSPGRGLEYGCGTGALGLELRDLFQSLLLVDSSAGMIAQVEKKLDALNDPSVSAMRWNLADAPLPITEVNTVITALALHHIGALQTVLENIRRLLNPRGRLLIIDMDQDGGVWHQHQAEFDGHHGFDRTELSAWLRDAGFAVRSVKTISAMSRTIEEQQHHVPLFLLDAEVR